MKTGWTLTTALQFIETLRGPLEEVSLHIGLTGSVLFRGASMKDLDLIVFPRSEDAGEEHQDSDSATTDRLNARMVFVANGMKVMVSRTQIQKIWRRKAEALGLKSVDNKWVEAWMLGDGRRIDIFFLR